MRVKLFLHPIPYRRLSDFVGKKVFLISGQEPVKFLSFKGQVGVIQFKSGQTYEIFFNTSTKLYQMAGFITSGYTDPDERYFEIAPSNYEELAKFLPIVNKVNYQIGLANPSTGQLHSNHKNIHLKYDTFTGYLRT